MFESREFAALAKDDLISCAAELLLVMCMEVPPAVRPDSNFGVVVVARDADLRIKLNCESLTVTVLAILPWRITVPKSSLPEGASRMKPVRSGCDMLKILLDISINLLQAVD